MTIDSSIDEYNSIRVQVEVVGSYKTIGYGAILDSGFSGDLVLPESTAVDIGLKAGGYAEVELADGSTSVINLYLCNVRIGETDQEAATLIMGNEVLIGMGLMTPYDVCFRESTGEVIMDRQTTYTDFVGVLHRLTGV